MCFRPPSVEESGNAVCSFCGEDNPKGSQVCEHCGKELLSAPKAAMGGSAIPTVPGIATPQAPRAPQVPGSTPPSVPKAPGSPPPLNT